MYITTAFCTRPFLLHDTWTDIQFNMHSTSTRGPGEAVWTAYISLMDNFKISSQSFGIS